MERLVELQRLKERASASELRGINLVLTYLSLMEELQGRNTVQPAAFIDHQWDEFQKLLATADMTDLARTVSILKERARELRAKRLMGRKG